MLSTEARRLPQMGRWLLLSGLMLVLTACGSFGGRDSEGDVTPADAAAPTDDFERIPNPYLAQAPEVPAEANSRFQKALALVASDDDESALQLLQQLVQDHPSLSGPHVNIGLIHWRQDRLDQAQAAFRRALEVNSLNIDAYNQLAILQRELGEFDQAESLYLQALKVWPHSPDSHLNLGILYDMYMGKLDKALEHYEMAAKLVNEPSRELQGWIIDLQRRMNSGDNS